MNTMASEIRQSGVDATGRWQDIGKIRPAECRRRDEPAKYKLLSELLHRLALPVPKGEGGKKSNWMKSFPRASHYISKILTTVRWELPNLPVHPSPRQSLGETRGWPKSDREGSQLRPAVVLRVFAPG